ncbi:MAG TPA: hypothetical protein VN892_06120, partial [Solirubrobacteraceae bacterium]|nr:hypothetical protein [Solirubrobacteraceae bacterium]
SPDALPRQAGPSLMRLWHKVRQWHQRPASRASTHAFISSRQVDLWAANSELVPEIKSNGCLFANEKIGHRRKSMRAAHGRRSVRRHGDEIRSWALSSLAVELIRAEMLKGTRHPNRPILAQRDAIVVSLQFGLALRNQEVYGVRWLSFANGKRARVTEVLSWNELDDQAKTERATGRTARVPALLTADLAVWRAALRQHGHPARDVDFVIPGDLTGPHNGIREPATGACHMSSNQAQQWRARCMKPAVEAVANSDSAFANMIGATPYGLRRGGISARLRAENAQSVANQCGTSLEMLSQHYSYEIDDLEHAGPQPLDQQWRKARAAVLAKRPDADRRNRAA